MTFIYALPLNLYFVRMKWAIGWLKKYIKEWSKYEYTGCSGSGLPYCTRNVSIDNYKEAIFYSNMQSNLNLREAAKIFEMKKLMIFK